MYKLQVNYDGKYRLFEDVMVNGKTKPFYTSEPEKFFTVLIDYLSKYAKYLVIFDDGVLKIDNYEIVSLSFLSAPKKKFKEYKEVDINQVYLEPQGFHVDFILDIQCK